MDVAKVALSVVPVMPKRAGTTQSRSYLVPVATRLALTAPKLAEVIDIDAERRPGHLPLPEDMESFNAGKAARRCRLIRPASGGRFV
jgi:hypothetical protein